MIIANGYFVPFNDPCQPDADERIGWTPDGARRSVRRQDDRVYDMSKVRFVPETIGVAAPPG